MYSDSACRKLMKQYKTDRNGRFETDYVRCGFDYYLKEITPPTGYLKNDKVYTIHEDGVKYTAEYNSAKNKQELGEDVIKGNVDITKIMTNGAVGITKPEVNAEFQIYLAGAGSYDKAKATEKDYLKTDLNGYAKSKDLPYGTYIVHQVTTMLANSEFVALLKQANTDSSKMAEVIGVSDAQLKFVTNSQSGMGLLKCGSTVIPFDNQISKDTGLYKLYNTNIHELFENKKIETER